MNALTRCSSHINWYEQLQLWATSLKCHWTKLIQSYFTSTKTVQIIRDGELRTPTSTFTQRLSCDEQSLIDFVQRASNSCSRCAQKQNKSRKTEQIYYTDSFSVNMCQISFSNMDQMAIFYPLTWDDEKQQIRIKTAHNSSQQQIRIKRPTIAGNPLTCQCQHQRRRPGGWASGIGGWKRPSGSPRSRGSCPRWRGSSVSSARCWPCPRWWCSGSSWCPRRGGSPHEWAARQTRTWVNKVHISTQTTLLLKQKQCGTPSSQTSSYQTKGT